jgi:hypothetical protein
VLSEYEVKVYIGLLLLGIVREPLGGLDFKFERTSTHEKLSKVEARPFFEI